MIRHLRSFPSMRNTLDLGKHRLRIQKPHPAFSSIRLYAAMNCSRVPRSGDTEPHRAKVCSAEERIGERGDELKQIGLVACTGFFEQSPEMRLYGFGRNAKHLGDLGYPAHLDDGKQHLKLP